MMNWSHYWDFILIFVPSLERTVYWIHSAAYHVLVDSLILKKPWTKGNNYINIYQLGGGWATYLQNIGQIGSSPRVKIKKGLKSPPR